MLSALRDAILAYSSRHAHGDGFHGTENPGLVVMRKSLPAEPIPSSYQPVLCVVVQGAKRAMLGDAVLDYGAGNYLMVSIELPITGGVVEATPDAPYTGLLVALDPVALREVADALGPGPVAPGLAAFVGELSDPMTDCLLRLVRLLDTPDGSRVLHGSIMRELYFWLLTGPEGPAFRHLARPSAHFEGVARAIERLRAEFDRPIRVDALAAMAAMSESTFFQHFKAATSMTPLQYQKQLRLLAARRRLLDGAAAAEVAHAVGYESASQFSREYARMFGAPPKRDVSAIRQVTLASSHATP